MKAGLRRCPRDLGGFRTKRMMTLAAGCIVWRSGGIAKQDDDDYREGTASVCQHPRRSAIACLFLLCGLLAGQAAFAQTGSLPKVPAQPGALPAPLENPLRRFEIITLGSFPIMLFYTDIGFGIGRYAASGFDPRYSPWALSFDFSNDLTVSERLIRIGVALGCSLIIGGVDAGLHARKVKRERALRNAPVAPQAIPDAATPQTPQASPLPSELDSQTTGKP